MQIAGMKLEGDKGLPVQRHSAPIPSAGKTEEPVAKHVTAALRQSAPAPKVQLCLCIARYSSVTESAQKSNCTKLFPQDLLAQNHG